MWKLFLLLIFSLSAGANVSLISNYCEYFYLKHDPSIENIRPILNVDRTNKYIKELPTRFKHDVDVVLIGHAEGEPIYRINLRSKNPNAPNILITAGVHGDEPFGVSTSLEILEKSVFDSKIRSKYNITIIPMLNPAGLRIGTRRTLGQIDVNRTFKPGHETTVTKIVRDNLEREEFERGFDLHGANKKDSFFVIKADEDEQNLALRTLEEIKDIPLLRSPNGVYPYNVPMTTDPQKTAYVLTGPGLSSSNNAGTVKSFFKSDLNIPNAYTLEYPGQISTFERQEGFVNLVLAFIRND